MSTKDKKYLLLRKRFLTNAEKFSLQGIPISGHDVSWLTESQQTDLAGNMYNAFSMVVLWAAFIGNFSWDWAN